MDTITKKQQFLQLQFSLVLLVCTLLPDFGNMFSAAIGLGGLSIFIIARVIGIVFGGWALYNFYQATGGKLPTPFLCGVGGGLVLTAITLIPGTPGWLDYIAIIALAFGLWVSKESLGVEWNTIGAQGAYLILIACLLNCYNVVDPKVTTSIAKFVGLIIYLVGLGKLTQSLDSEGMKGASRLKTAVWLGIVAACFSIIPLLGGVIAGILAIIAFVFEFLGYTDLTHSDPLHQEGRDGASKLRISMIIMVVATLIGFIPVVGKIPSAIVALIALWFIYKGWMKILFGLEK